MIVGGGKKLLFLQPKELGKIPQNHCKAMVVPCSAYIQAIAQILQANSLSPPKPSLQMQKVTSQTFLRGGGNRQDLMGQRKGLGLMGQVVGLQNHMAIGSAQTKGADTCGEDTAVTFPRS
jgi:hypothetical protein